MTGIEWLTDTPEDHRIDPGALWPLSERGERFKGATSHLHPYASWRVILRHDDGTYGDLHFWREPPVRGECRGGWQVIAIREYPGTGL